MNMARGEGIELAQLAAAVGAQLCGPAAGRVTGVHHDSRRVEPGDLFVARRGEQADGITYVPQAVSKGAAAVLAQRDHAPAVAAVPVLLVDDIRVAIGRASALVYGDPTAALRVVGITGTNGKTTTSYLVRGALQGAGQRPGVLGTLGATFEDLRFAPLHTTPEADEVTRVA
ncbi:MAG: Mur ligase domain-containing protein, partial [Polyangiaceae bacterium]|nr:Mur ligase domain-containing protein [Polyangiaceae bacterium]